MRLIFFTLACVAFMALGGPARADMGLHAGSHFGIGAIGSKGNPGNPERSLGTFDIQAMPGWRLPNKIMPGLMLDYRFHTQLEEGTVTGGQDYAGQSLLIGIGAEYEIGQVKLLATFDPLARHWANGPEATLKGSGLHLLLGLQFETNWYVDLMYSYASYDEAGIGGLDQHQEDPITHWNLALGVSCAY